MASESLPLPLLEPPAEVIAFRWCTYDVPFWVRENRRAGRWNLDGDASTQYWSLSPEAAWAELIRHENLRSEEDLDLVRVPFWVCRVRAALLIDLGLSEVRERNGITTDQLISEDWSPCQQLAPHLRVNWDGVISPSAALPGEANLTLFGPRRAIGWSSRPALASALPTSRVAVGRPPPGLLPRVVYRQSGQQEALF